MITLSDIGEKVFSDQELGYSKEEVDEFLDALAEDYAKLLTENRNLKKRLEQQDEKKSDDKALSSPGFLKNMEAVLQDTLLSAQRKAEETESTARKSADETIAAAEEKARTLVSEAKVEAEQARADLDDIKAAIEDYRAKFKRLVMDQMQILRADPDLFGDN